MLLEEVALGLYVGVLTGVFAAVIVYVLTLVFTYVADAKLSVNYALMIGLGIAGLAGGPRLLLRNPEILQSATSLVMLVVILITTFYAHQKAQDLGKALPPKSVAIRALRSRSLASSVVRQLGSYGEVTIRPTGAVGDLEGYPPLPADVRAAIQGDSWALPADLPIPELESRIREKLRRAHHLEEVLVAIDGDGRATIRAAPELGGFSRRVRGTDRVVTLEALLPAGIGSGDEVEATFETTTLRGTVVGVDRDEGAMDDQGERTADGAAETDEVRSPGPNAVEPGMGRVALAVDPTEVETVMAEDLAGLFVRSRGRTKEFEFVSLLARHGLRFRKVTIGPGASLAGQSLGDLGLRDSLGVVVLARKRPTRWDFAPRRSVVLEAGDELFVTGPGSGLDSFAELVA